MSGWAAARSFWPEAPADRVDLLVRSAAKTPHYRVVPQRVDPDHIMHLGDVRLTSPAWTAVWLAAHDGGAAIDAALRAGLPVSELDAALDSMRGLSGNRERREIVEWSRLKPWSQLERAVHRILTDAGITGWQGNQPCGTSTGNRYVLDIAFVEQKLAIELDGYAFHGTRDAWLRDMRKTNDLQLDGWTVLHFGWADLSDPEKLIAQVRRSLAERRP